MRYPLCFKIVITQLRCLKTDDSCSIMQLLVFYASTCGHAQSKPS